MTKIKLKSKKTIKVKAKVKSKPKATPKKKPTSKSTLKSKSKSKPTKAKSKIKKQVKAKKKPVLTATKKKKMTAKKTVAKVKKKAPKLAKKTKPKLKLVRKAKPSYRFSDTQKGQILTTIEKIINLHKSDQDGLKSLTKIQDILDKYNQKYTEAGEKFDAIVQYGMDENPLLVYKHVFVPKQGKDKETLDLYKFLLDIGQLKIKFTDAKRRIEDLYADAQESRQ